MHLHAQAATSARSSPSIRPTRPRRTPTCRSRSTRTSSTGRACSTATTRWRRSPGEGYERLAEQARRAARSAVGDGTDLTLGVGGRTWIPCDGRENFPDGEVFTGPVETQVDGVVRFSYPASYAGRRVSGVELEFRGGEVVRAQADEGNTFLQQMLALDEGARRAGEFSFGLNEAVTEFTGHTLFDEKIGGTAPRARRVVPGVRRAGRVGPSLGPRLRPAERGEVYADGELVYRDGRFVDGVLRTPARVAANGTGVRPTWRYCANTCSRCALFCSPLP